MESTDNIPVDLVHHYSKTTPQVVVHRPPLSKLIDMRRALLLLSYQLQQLSKFLFHTMSSYVCVVHNTRE